jgi:hypothetical protein
MRRENSCLSWSLSCEEHFPSRKFAQDTFPPFVYAFPPFVYAFLPLHDILATPPVPVSEIKLNLSYIGVEKHVRKNFITRCFELLYQKLQDSPQNFTN